jgi:hypothetical protein
MRRRRFVDLFEDVVAGGAGGEETADAELAPPSRDLTGRRRIRPSRASACPSAAA